jgi:hypothetical protein
MVQLNYGVYMSSHKDTSEVSVMTVLTLNLLTTTIVAPTSNASKWQMGFNLAFKGLMLYKISLRTPYALLCSVL